MKTRRINLLDLATGDETFVEFENENHYQVWFPSLEGKAAYQWFNLVSFLKRFKVISIAEQGQDIDHSKIPFANQMEVTLWDIDNNGNIAGFTKEAFPKGRYDLLTYHLRNDTTKTFKIPWKLI